MLKIILFFLIFLLNLRGVLLIPYYQCDDPIYCTGPILHQAQILQIFHHSKTFVDLRLSNTPDVILQNFDIFMFKNNHKPSKRALKKFIRENFSDGDELENWIGEDYVSKPWWLDTIADPVARNLTYGLIQVWPKLGKKIRSHVFRYPVHHSIIALKNGFIVPGGIFRESYYLESYWTVKALLICEMTTTVRGILDNFVAMHSKYGYIPKGSRIYFTNNWQPPVLAILVNLYMKHTNDLVWLRENIFYLEHEIRHWVHYRICEIKRDNEKYTLMRYTNRNPYPRPNFYLADLTACQNFTGEEKTTCYHNIKAPGGFKWFYHERFIFDENNGVNGTLANSAPKRLLPVDLNVYMCKSFQSMANIFDALNDRAKYEYYKNFYDQWVRSIHAVLYNKTDGIWYDYDMATQRHRRYCYPTNFAPLWLNIYERRVRPKLGKQAVDYFKRMNMMPYRATSHQPVSPKYNIMDMWSPYQTMVALALYNSDHSEAVEYANEFARRWLEKNKNCECCMYDMSDDIGLRTKEFQRGCGWVVAASLVLIDTFYRNMTATDVFSEN